MVVKPTSKKLRKEVLMNMRNIYDWSFLCKMVMVYLDYEISDS